MRQLLKTALSVSLIVYLPTATASTPFVQFETNVGNFTVELDPVKAPVTVANFLQYYNEGFYSNTLMHRSVKGFVVQGGGFDAGSFTQKTVHAPIINEANNGLHNVKGTIAMARTFEPNSATSQFFVNVADNRSSLDYGSSFNSAGYAVFGKVVDGMAVIDSINALAVAGKIYNNVSSQFQELPVVDPAKPTFVVVQKVVSVVPVANAGIDTAMTGGNPVTLDGSGSTDQTPGTTGPLQYTWTQISGPNVALITGSNPATATFTAPEVSESTVLSFQLKVANSFGNQSTNNAVVNITIRNPLNNQPPVSNAGSNGVIRAGGVLVLDGSASHDPDNDKLSYLWTGPAGIVIDNPTSAKASAAIPENLAGSKQSFQLTVSDGALSSSRNVDYDVLPAITPPTVSLENPAAIIANQPLTLTPNIGNASDGNITYHWEQTGGSPVLLGSADTPTLKITAPNVSTATSLIFVLTVTDYSSGAPLSSSATSVVQVNPATQLDCSFAKASPANLWPPGKGLIPVSIAGIGGPKDFKLKITGVQTDQPVKNKALGDNTGPDAKIRKGKISKLNPKPKDSVLLRAERQVGNGNGRTYTLLFNANDGSKTCTGSATVSVPVDFGATVTGNGKAYNALKSR